MDFRRIKQVFEYGWKDAIALSKEDGANSGKWSIFLDILVCFFRYNVWSNQYKKEKLHLLSKEEKRTVCLKYQEKNTKRDQWVKDFFNNYKFLYKWSSFKYETSASLQAKRRAAYKKQYGLGDNCFVGYDVKFHKHHYVESMITTGRNCLIAEHTDIDYTGGIILGNQVAISEGVKILTHNHDLYGNAVGEGKRKLELTPLQINDNVWIGARAFIQPGVGVIGRGALIGAGSVVRHSVPPYAIVLGNPAKVVGFSFNPEEVLEHEKTLYPKEECLPFDLLEKNYNKYFLNRIKDIKEWNKL